MPEEVTTTSCGTKLEHENVVTHDESPEIKRVSDDYNFVSFTTCSYAHASEAWPANSGPLSTRSYLGQP